MSTWVVTPKRRAKRGEHVTSAPGGNKTSPSPGDCAPGLGQRGVPWCPATRPTCRLQRLPGRTPTCTGPSEQRPTKSANGSLAKFSPGVPVTVFLLSDPPGSSTISTGGPRWGPPPVSRPAGAHTLAASHRRSGRGQGPRGPPRRSHPETLDRAGLLMEGPLTTPGALRIRRTPGEGTRPTEEGCERAYRSSVPAPENQPPLDRAGGLAYTRSS